MLLLSIYQTAIENWSTDKWNYFAKGQKAINQTCFILVRIPALTICARLCSWWLGVKDGHLTRQISCRYVL